MLSFLLYGDDSLTRAVRDERWDNAREMLHQSNAWRLARHSTRSNQWSTAHWACSRNAPLDVMEALREAWPNVLATRDSDGWSPLHAACLWASEDVVAFVLEHRPDDAAVPNRNGELPIHDAVFKRRLPSVVARLLRARPDAAHTRNENGDAALDVFAAEWAWDVRERVLNKTTIREGGLLDRVSDKGLEELGRDMNDMETDDAHAVDVFRETLSLLLRATTTTMSLENEDEDWSPLLEATRRSELPDPVVWLLARTTKNESKAARKDWDGNFPLHLACARRSSYDDEDRE